MTMTNASLPAARKVPVPPGFFSAALRVAQIAPFRTLRGKRLLALTVLAILPTLIAVLMRIGSRNRALGVGGFADFMSVFFLGGITPLTLLFLGAAAIGDDIDNGTLLYLRLRPISRGAIALGRYLALLVSALFLLLPAITLDYFVQVGWRGTDAVIASLPVLGAAAMTIALAAAAYGALFLYLSLITRFAVVLGFFFVIGWEIVISLLPSKGALFTVSFHCRAFLWQLVHEGPRLYKPLRSSIEAGLTPAPAESAASLLVATAVLVALAAFAFRSREYAEHPGEA